MSRTRHHGWKWAKFPRYYAAPMTTPGWWVCERMNRPKRARDRALLRHVAAERIDADAAAFNVGSRKPQVYYY